MTTLSELAGTTEFKEYDAVSKEIAKYYITSSAEPAKLMHRYKLAIRMYRNLLDRLNLRMPKSRYPYYSEDKMTWKYSDFESSGNSGNGIKFKRWIENPKWIYKKQLTQGVGCHGTGDSK